jgi:hypothetical protein
MPGSGKELVSSGSNPRLGMQDEKAQATQSAEVFALP